MTVAAVYISTADSPAITRPSYLLAAISTNSLCSCYSCFFLYFLTDQRCCFFLHQGDCFLLIEQIGKSRDHRCSRRMVYYNGTVHFTWGLFANVLFLLCAILIIRSRHIKGGIDHLRDGLNFSAQLLLDAVKIEPIFVGD